MILSDLIPSLPSHLMFLFSLQISDLITLLPEHLVLFKCNDTNIANVVSLRSCVHLLSTKVLSAIKI